MLMPSKRLSAPARRCAGSCCASAEALQASRRSPLHHPHQAPFRRRCCRCSLRFKNACRTFLLRMRARGCGTSQYRFFLFKSLASVLYWYPCTNAADARAQSVYIYSCLSGKRAAVFLVSTALLRTADARLQSCASGSPQDFGRASAVLSLVPCFTGTKVPALLVQEIKY